MLPNLTELDLTKILEMESVEVLLRALATGGLGLPLVFFLSRGVGGFLRKRTSEHLGMLVQKLIFYLGSILLVFSLLLEFGFNLTAVLGAAGILSIAVGFAAQTSLSNIISGIFLYSESPFRVGDLIRVGDLTGTVLSIDLMSVKIRTFDNLFIRIPNETIIKSQVTTVTRFPIRRMDFPIGVAYREDIGRVMKIIREVAEANPYCLDDPEPFILFKEFGASSLNITVGLWFEKSQFTLLKNSFMEDIKKRFDAEDIEIPFPHVTVYTGSRTDPFPLSMSRSQSGDKLPLQSDSDV